MSSRVRCASDFCVCRVCGRRALVVVESPFDSFGPATYERDELGFTNRDLVPAEANQKELYGDLDPLAAPWRKPPRRCATPRRGSASC